MDAALELVEADGSRSVVHHGAQLTQAIREEVVCGFGRVVADRREERYICHDPSKRLDVQQEAEVPRLRVALIDVDRESRRT